MVSDHRLWFCRDQLEANQATAERKTQKGALKQQQQERNHHMERQRKENEFKKIFQVIHGLNKVVWMFSTHTDQEPLSFRPSPVLSCRGRTRSSTRPGFGTTGAAEESWT